ncbi:acyl carrier protein [uncultured Microbacterium sp.]|uniref:acyl carrier protein n=1 Tax=uncultured Microbacterium sp. TaxID=191216 RepID=UPI0026067102|nr:phosphopantetheine-binding protein [uncultured Microbacterium sp.]
MDYQEVTQRAIARRALNDRVKELIAEGLGLHIAATLIDDDQPLFGRGLELDSLDTLEIVSLIDENFGVYITDDDTFVFGSINAIADFIEQARVP